jgi:hypothetical protein
LSPVILGAAVYGFLMLKLDKKICDEMRLIVEKVGIGFIWPDWL